MLEIVPDPFVGIQVRCIGRQACQVDASRGTVGQELAKGLAAMDGGAIPDDQQLARDLLEQQLEKGDDIIAIKGLVLHAQVELPFRRDGTDG